MRQIEQEGFAMLCPQCGNRMEGDYPDKKRWFNCASCGDRFIVEDDGELVNVRHRRKKSGRTCVNCGRSLEGGKHTAPWENGNNPDEYIVCPHCHYANFLWDDD